MAKYAITGIINATDSFRVNNAVLRVDNITSPVDIYFQNRGGSVALELPIIIVNSNTTAQSWNSYGVNTISNAITLTLPSTVSQGELIEIFDYSNTFGAHNCTIARNGHKIEGLAENLVLDVSGFFLQLKYINATVGFKRVS